MKVYGVKSHAHLGDSIITAGAVHNVKLSRPDLRFKYTGWCAEIWDGNPDIEGDAVAVDHHLPLIDYGRVAEEQRASRGNVVEAFTRSLCEFLGIGMVPIASRVPYAVLNECEKKAGEAWQDAILLNANGQTVSFSKAYPYWQEVVNSLLKTHHRIVQVGSREKRNLTLDLEGVEDMRGKTENVRDLLSMVYGCKGVVSPPSGIVNIAAAFGKKAVVVCAARELPALTDYPNMEHVVCDFEPCWMGPKWKRGCIALTDNGLRNCRHVVRVGGRRYAGCMAQVSPERIVEACGRVFG